MKKVLFFVLVFWAVEGDGQVVPLRAGNWDFPAGSVVFEEGAGSTGPVMKIVGRGYAVAKKVDFTDGTIEFDEQPLSKDFASFYFHWQDSLESEVFYFRTRRGLGHPDARDGVQYAPIIKGVNLWNVMDHYQTFATFSGTAPNHVKLVISGKQMRVYLNSQPMPVLAVPRLEGNTTHGSLAFQGEAIISHLVLKPGQVEGLSPMEGIDPTSTDSRYIRHWQVTRADSIPAPVDFSMVSFPGKSTEWMPLMAERRGFVNLTRLYGGGYAHGHHMAWLKTTIHSDTVKTVQLRLGFVDEVWMFLNGEWLYVDKNLFRQPIAKVPDGRLSIENATVGMPLKKGDNELLIAVGNNFFGWGVVARIDDVEGVHVE